MIKNNLLSLVGNILVTVLMLAISTGAMNLSPTFPNQFGTGELVLQILLSIITLVVFLLVGRFLLKDTGSLWKNALSLMLPFIIGLFIAISVSTSPHQLNLSALYYSGYSSPFVFSLSPSSLSIVPYENSLLYGVVFSLIPSVLYIVGIQWQVKFKKSARRS